MIYALAILILAAALCYLCGFVPGRSYLARVVALLGCAIALAIALYFEGLDGDGLAGAPVALPDVLNQTGLTFYRSDTLAASLGAWCIVLGGLCLLKLGRGEQAASRLAAALLSIATLYSLVYTADLRAFAAEVLLLVLLASTILLGEEGQPGLLSRRISAQIIGATALLVAVLLMGRTTGGIYGIADMSLSALTFWPLFLLVLFFICWIGLAPITGWSALMPTGPGWINQGSSTLLQALMLPLPVLVLLLRLQALITDQAIAGSTPTEWRGFMGATALLGGATMLAAAAGTIVWAGTARWSAALTASLLGGAVWALSLDTPTGRYAAIVIVLAFGVSRLTLDLAGGLYGWLAQFVSGLSFAGAPLTAGFIGIWLLGSGLVESRQASLAIVAVGAAILSACGVALHLGVKGSERRAPATKYDTWLSLVALVTGSLTIVAGGILPALWLPQVEAVANIAGGGPRLAMSWSGLLSGALFAPLTLLGGAVAVLAAIAWLVRVWARSRKVGNSILLPTAVAKLQGLDDIAPAPRLVISNPPPSVWWLSLVWLESGIYGSGALLGRFLSRLGLLFARLEGRYYFPLAIILTLLIILAITR